MIGLGTLLIKELREQWRTRRLLVLVVVFGIFGIASPLLARYTPELLGMIGTDEGIVIDVPPPTSVDAVAQFVRNIGQTGVLAAMWLTKPVSRGSFLAAKEIGIAAVLAAGIVAAGLAGFIYTSLLFEVPGAGGWALMCFLLLLQVLAYAAATFLGSTLTQSPLAAAGVGIGALTVIAILGALPVVGAWTPSALADAALAIGAGTEPEHTWQPIVATLLLVGAVLVAAWAAFRRQEL